MNGAARRYIHCWLLAALLGMAACSPAAAPSAPHAPALDPALDAYGRLPTLEDVALAPNGARLALVHNTADGRFILIASLADGAALAKLGVGDTKLRNFQWVDDDTLLLETSVAAVPTGTVGTRREWSMLQTYDVVEGELRPLLSGSRSTSLVSQPTRTMNVSIGPSTVRRLDGRSVLFVHGMYATDRTLPALFRIDLDSGREQVVEKGSPATRSWWIDDAGVAVLEERYDEPTQRWSLWLRRDGVWQEIAASHDPYATERIVGFGPQNGTVVVRVLEDKRTVWKPLSLADGSWGAPMAQNTTWSESVIEAATQRVIGGMPDGVDASYVFFDPTMQARWAAITRSLRGERGRPITWTRDGSKIVVLADDRRGPVYRLVDFDRGDTRRIGPQYEGLQEVAEVRRIAYRAADGLLIGGYLTLPSRRLAEDLPLIVLVHGGPAAHDAGGFDWWAQAIAAQGYAVLQPNFRGSDVDPTLLAAGFGEWGRKMQTDLSDGVRYLADVGTIDPRQVCIVGASYGGYAALAGVALQPGVYRCAVAVGGLSDMRAFLRFVAQRDGQGVQAAFRYWNRFLGTTNGDDAALDAISPLAHAGAVDAPVLLIHGRDDTVVPHQQSAAMAAALEHAGKPVELVTLNGEDHWLSRSGTRLEMLRNCIAFLRANNPPPPPLPIFSGQR